MGAHEAMESLSDEGWLYSGRRRGIVSLRGLFGRLGNLHFSHVYQPLLDIAVEGSVCGPGEDSLA